MRPEVVDGLEVDNAGLARQHCRQKPIPAWIPIALVAGLILLLVVRVFVFYFHHQRKTRTAEERLNQKVSQWLSSNDFAAADETLEPLLDSPQDCVIDMEP